MKAEKINEILENIYNKSENQEEKNALLEACGCVWASRMNKVVNVSSFMNMLYENMGYEYNVDVKTTKNETVFCIKTFMK